MMMDQSKSKYSKASILWSLGILILAPAWLAVGTSDLKTDFNSNRQVNGKQVKNTALFLKSTVGTSIFNGPIKRRIFKARKPATLGSNRYTTTARTPELDEGMTNVTDNGLSYQFRHVTKTNGTVAVKFNSNNIPAGYTAADIYSYWFNDKLSRWMRLKRDSIDVKNNLIYSQSNNDGEYINAIIKVPEAPETQGYMPTTMNDIKIGDPASMVQLIEPPKANNQGAATLSYRIEVPAGRLGIQPDFTISYSSDTGNGWIGEGWSLGGISSISVDTRWGVPRYLPNTESETYMLDGQMLAFKSNGATANRHTDIKRTDVTTNNIAVFYPRKQSEFKKIERIGSLPDNYKWVITDQNGTKYFYGGVNAIDENATLQTDRKNIAEWKLVRVEDVFKNAMVFAYDKKTDNGTAIVPSYVDYTLSNNPNLSYHRITFEYDTIRKDDASYNGRYGLVANATALKLKSVTCQRILNSSGDSQLIRKYIFDYKNGAFNRTLLNAITQYGDNYDTDSDKNKKNSRFYKQQFTYYNEDGNLPDFTTITANTSSDADGASMPNPDNILNTAATVINASQSNGSSSSMYVGVGLGRLNSVNHSAGARFGSASSNAQGMNTLMDMDGDGLPDKVFINGRNAYYKKNISKDHVIAFDKNRIALGDQPQFMVEKSRTSSVEARGYINLTAGYESARTESVVETYFSDANGDGLTDIVNGGNVYFNTGKIKDENLRFSLYSSDTPSLVYGTGNFSTNFAYDTAADTEFRKNNPLHEVVRVWEAPFDGVVKVEAPAKLLPVSDCKISDGVHLTIEHKEVLQKEITIAENDYILRPITINNMAVAKGEKIFFRLQSGVEDESNGSCDLVEWNPIVAYETAPQMAIDKPVENQKASRYQYDASQDFMLSNTLPYDIAENVTQIDFSGSFEKNITMDTVTVQVVQWQKNLKKPLKDRKGNTIRDPQGNIVYDYSPDSKPLFEQKFNPEETAQLLTIPRCNIAPKERRIQFVVKSDVNINLSQVKWEPEISFLEPVIETQFDNGNNPSGTSPRMVPKKMPAIPYYVFNDTLKYTGDYHSIVADSALDFYPSVDFTDDDINGSFWFSVKSYDRVLAKKRINFTQGYPDDDTPLHVFIKKDTPFLTTIEAVSDTIGKLKSKTYQAILDKVHHTEHYFPGNTIKGLITPTSSPTPPSAVHQVAKSGIYKINSSLAVTGNKSKGKIMMEIWVNSQKKQTAAITFKEDHFVFPPNGIRIGLKIHDQLTVLYVIDNDTLRNNVLLKSNFTLHETFLADFLVNRHNETFGPMYRNWGQFIYNGMNQRSKVPIKNDSLIINHTAAANVDAVNFNNNVNQAVKDTTAIAIDADLNKLASVNSVFLPMTASVKEKKRAWFGGEDEIFLQAKIAGTSRLGVDEVKSNNPFVVVTNGNANASFFRGIPKVALSRTETFSGGAGFISGSYTKGEFNQLSDFIDMNGDKYPDIVNSSLVQLTFSNGILDASTSNPFGTHKGNNEGNGMSVSGSSGRSLPGNTKSGKGKASNGSNTTASNAATAGQEAAMNTGASIAFNIGTDITKSTLIDLNADGLPDKVNKNDYDLNLGNGNFISMPFASGTVNETINFSQSPGISVGLSFDKRSFTSGAGLSFSAGKSVKTIQDINGDGLPDRVSINNTGELMVEINNGKDFISYLKPWLNVAKGGNNYNTLGSNASLAIKYMPRNGKTDDWFLLEKTKFNSSNGVSFNTGFTFGFYIPFTVIKVVFNPEFGRSFGIGRTIRQIIDINGDGYQDLVYSTSEDEIEASLSNLGKTNKLKQVANDFGGTFIIDYAHADATTENPGGKWVMSSVEIDDAVKTDREINTATYDRKKIFSYTAGKYDRYEREFLGFGETVTTELDFYKNPYRSFVSKYNASDYYNAGQLIEEYVCDANDKNKIYTGTHYTYASTPLQSNTISIGSFHKETGILFCPLKSTVTYTMEGSKNKAWLNKSTYAHENNYGLLTVFAFKENPSGINDTNYDYKTTVTYEKEDLANYVIGLPVDVLTTGSNKKI